MKLIFKNGGFERYVDVRPAPPGLTALSFHSVWRESKEPEYMRENFCCLLDEKAVEALITALCQTTE